MESGFYWVRMNRKMNWNDSDVTVAWYSAPYEIDGFVFDESWLIIGYEVDVQRDEIAEIGERIEIPHESP